MTQTSLRLTPFPLGWFSFDLKGYRSCDHTYCLFPYEELPPLPEAQFKEKLQWLEPLAKSIERQMRRYRPRPKERARSMNRMKEIVDSARQLGLSLPDAFLQVMTSPDLQDRIPSCTACYFDLPEKIVPCPGSEEGYLIRFLNDQQAVLMWYLYVTPRGEHCILVSHYRFYELAEHPKYINDVTEEQRRRALQGIYVCAPSFEAFLYRFWLENILWYKLSWYKGQKPLTEEEKQYLSHYSSCNEEL
jgi:hypothetical protein